MNENKLRELICLFAKGLYDRGMAHGSAGNISSRCDDGGLLVTPTNSSFGFLDPALLAKFDRDGNQLSGCKPTKEMSLHTAFYDTRGSTTGAVVHLHSHYSVALSMMPDVDPDDMLLPLTPYPIMKLGKVKLLPYFEPGDAAMGQAVKDLGGKHSAVILANHGPVVAGKDIQSAVFAIEELEAAARLSLETYGRDPILITPDEVVKLTATYDKSN
ncbi:MAG: 3-oxo-tetronate 4-phosphate decarboxylase [Pseudomonadota bacterium]